MSASVQVREKNKVLAASKLETILKRRMEHLEPELQSALRQLCAIDQTFWDELLKQMWESGRLLTALGKAGLCTNAEGYHVPPLSLVADLLQVPEGRRCMMKYFYQSFPSEQSLQEMIALRMKCGQPLVWEHLAILMQFCPYLGGAGRQQFDHWLRRTLENDWAPATLKKQIAKAQNAKQKTAKDSRPRAKSVLPTFEKECARLISQLDYLSHMFERYYRSPDSGILASLRSMPAPEVRAQRAMIEQKLNVIRDWLEKVVAHAKNMDQDCEEGLTLVSKACGQPQAVEFGTGASGEGKNKAALPVPR